jgi:ribonuclease Z
MELKPVIVREETNMVKMRGNTPLKREGFLRPGRITVGLLAVTVLAFAVGYLVGFGFQNHNSAEAAGGPVADPKGTAPDRYVYYPGTEPLKPDEIRLIACGTGMPAARRGQAASSWVFELGNGDKFIFDVGTGSMANVMSLMIPANMLTKVFASHLHTDHVGDLAALWAGGWTGGRTVPLEVWGPSGSREDMGTAYFVEHFLKAYNWDYMTRAVKVNPIPGGITAHEFDYKGENQVVYQENGVTIRSWPAIHAGDGPVSYSLEWNGLKVVFGGDTFPTSWFVKYAKDADVVIHECMNTAWQLSRFYNQTPRLAVAMNTDFHTSAQAFGKVMSMIEPRHAISYHFFNEEGTRYGIHEAIRQTYDGPLSMATDMMVWNISKDEVVERMAVSTDEAWDVPGAEEGLAPDPSRESETVWQELIDQRMDVADVNQEWLDAFKKETGLGN